MTTPNITLTVIDPGLGTPPPGKGSPIYFGNSELGTNNELVAVTSKDQMIGLFGQGQLSEAVCHHMDIAGAPVWCMKLPNSVAKSVSSVTKTSTGPNVTAAFDGYENYNVLITVTKAGALGTAQFNYSLDGGLNYSATRIIPSGGTFIPTNTKLTLTFAAGTYVLGEIYSLSTTAPMFSSGDVTTAATVVLNQSVYTSFPYFTFVGLPADSTASAAIVTAVDVAVTAQRDKFRYCRGIADFASLDTVNNAVDDAIVTKVVGTAYGYTLINSSKPFEGFGAFTTSLSLCASVRAAIVKPCTNLGRFASGPLNGVLDCSYVSIPGSEDPIDGAYIMTATRYPDNNSIYLAHGLLMSGPGSDYKNWSRGMVMDLACRITYKASLQFLNSTVATKEDGTITEVEAARIEAAIQGALDDGLINVRNDEGTLGFVSAVRYTVDRTVNINTTNKLQAKVAIRPLGDIEFIETALGYSLNA